MSKFTFTNTGEPINDPPSVGFWESMREALNPGLSKEEYQNLMLENQKISWKREKLRKRKIRAERLYDKNKTLRVIFRQMWKWEYGKKPSREHINFNNPVFVQAVELASQLPDWQGKNY